MRLALLALLAMSCDMSDLDTGPRPGPSREEYCTTQANMQEHGWQLDFFNACMYGHASPMDGGAD